MTGVDEFMAGFEEWKEKNSITAEYDPKKVIDVMSIDAMETLFNIFKDHVEKRTDVPDDELKASFSNAWFAYYAAMPEDARMQMAAIMMNCIPEESNYWHTMSSILALIACVMKMCDSQ